MALKIRLTNAVGGTYRPGDLLCGTLVLDLSSQCYVESVSISLTGSSIVSIDAECRTTGVASPNHVDILLRRHAILQQEPTPSLLQQGTSVWPFACEIPTHAEFDFSRYDIERASFFEVESPWRGSSDMESLKLPQTTYYGSMATGFSCAIQYTLLARVIRPPSAHLDGECDLAAHLSLQIDAIKPIPPMTKQLSFNCHGVCDQTKQSSIQSLRILDPFLRTPKLRTCISTGAKGDDEIRLKVDLPGPVLCHKSPVSMTISATHNGQAPWNRKVLSLKTVKLNLIVHTKVRTKRTKRIEDRAFSLINKREVLEMWPGQLGDPTSEMSMQEENEILSLGTGMISYAHNMSSISFCGTSIASVAMDLPPEFATTNIFRSYSLSFEIRYEYEKRSYTFKERCVPIDLNQYVTNVTHDEMVMEDGAENWASSSTNIFQGSWDGSELPPQYEMFCSNS